MAAHVGHGERNNIHHGFLIISILLRLHLGRCAACGQHDESEHNCQIVLVDNDSLPLLDSFFSADETVPITVTNNLRSDIGRQNCAGHRCVMSHHFQHGEGDIAKHSDVGIGIGCECNEHVVLLRIIDILFSAQAFWKIIYCRCCQ